jgi:hypothetical protein
MNDLSKRKHVTAVRTGASVRRRSLIVELHPNRPHELLIREQGRRASSGYWVSFEAIFSVGAKLAAIEAANAKRAARKAKGGAR